MVIGASIGKIRQIFVGFYILVNVMVIGASTQLYFRCSFFLFSYRISDQEVVFVT
jgi:hypothetical protein